MAKQRLAEGLRRHTSATCRNCKYAASNQPFSNRLYCIILGTGRRTAVGREHTCQYFERKL